MFYYDEEDDSKAPSHWNDKDERDCFTGKPPPPLEPQNDTVYYTHMLPSEVRMLTIGFVHIDTYMQELRAAILAVTRCGRDGEAYINKDEVEVTPSSVSVLEDKHLRTVVKSMFPQCTRVMFTGFCVGGYVLWGETSAKEHWCTSCPFHLKWRMNKK